MLLNQIKAQAYERSLAEGKSHNFPTALPECLAERAEEALKSSYNLGIRQQVKERNLEDRLINWLRNFILELGYGPRWRAADAPPSRRRIHSRHLQRGLASTT